MVDSIVSTVLERLTTAVIDKAEGKVKLMLGAKDDVEKLQRNFRAIKAVLADANQKQLREASVRDWIDNLKDVSYDIDDALDQWSTEIQKARKEASGKIAKATKEIVLNRDIALKIEELNSRLHLIASQRNTHQLRQLGSNENPPARPPTISAIDVTKVIGRDQDKQKVISMLMGEKGKTPSLPVVSIVGVGGIGKSTLAQLVFNDPTVMDHFKYKRIWVHVSNPFDEIKVANAILESLTGDASNYKVLESITQKIQELIEGKCFLLILDDVWTEDPRKWEFIKNFLLGGSPNSRILVTTRKEKIAKLMGCTESNMVCLGELSTEDSWSLFSQLAFYSCTDPEPLEMKSISKQLVAKCHGLPLAIKSLGIYLSTCKTRQKWLSLLGSEIWAAVAEPSLLPSLWFSYTDLTCDLKQCFSYCSVFPKGCKIEKYKLIEQWMAQGYLSGKRGKDEETAGDDYFQDLAARSFFQNFEKDKDNSIVACKMHDMVHDLAQYVASAESRHVEVQSSWDDLIEMDSSSTTQPRHSNIIVTDQTLLPAHFENMKKLRTLFVHSKSYLTLEPETLNDLFSKLSCLRSLDLSSCGLEQIPSSISSLIHLRWLDLSHNRDLIELPEALCELHNLLTLDIRGCFGIEKLPQGIGKLVKLKHLHNYDCWASTPKGIGRLSSLRTLEFFVLGKDGEAATLGDLNSLKNIQGRLTIILMGDVADLDEANQAQLKQRDLTKLELQFFGSGCQDQEVLEALEPPPSLRNLGILSYWGSSLFPNWLLSLTSLRKLKLTNCRCKHLPPLGKLKHLEHLQIVGFGELEKVGIEFLGVETSYEDDDHTHELEIFPKLEKLEFAIMPKWEAWNDINNSRNVAIMPRLRYLYLYDCEKLEALPEYVRQHPTLEKVEASSCCTLLEKYRNNEWPKFTHDLSGHGYLKSQLREEFKQGNSERGKGGKGGRGKGGKGGKRTV